ncbi:MAG TPA: hypothetical protein VIP55_04815, partial [Agromyces sp.]
DVDAVAGLEASDAPLPAVLAAVDPHDHLVAIVEPRARQLKVVTGFPPAESQESAESQGGGA